MKHDMTDDELISAIENARIELAKAEIAQESVALSLKKLQVEYEVRRMNNQAAAYRYTFEEGPRGE